MKLSSIKFWPPTMSVRSRHLHPNVLRPSSYVLMTGVLAIAYLLPIPGSSMWCREAVILASRQQTWGGQGRGCSEDLGCRSWSREDGNRDIQFLMTIRIKSFYDGRESDLERRPPVMWFVADTSCFLGVEALFTWGYLILATMRMLVSVNRSYEANWN